MIIDVYLIFFKHYSNIKNIIQLVYIVKLEAGIHIVSVIKYQ